MFHIAHANRVHLLTMALWFSSVPEMQAVKRHEFDSCYDDGQSHVSTDSEEAVMQTQLSKSDTSSHASKAVAEATLSTAVQIGCYSKGTEQMCKVTDLPAGGCKNCFPGHEMQSPLASEDTKGGTEINDYFCCVTADVYKDFCGALQTSNNVTLKDSKAYKCGQVSKAEADAKAKAAREEEAKKKRDAAIKAKADAANAAQAEAEKKEREEKAEYKAIMEAAGIKENSDDWKLMSRRADTLSEEEGGQRLHLQSKFDAAKKKLDDEKAAAAAATTPEAGPQPDAQCFGGESRLRLANGSTIPLSLAEKGMNIWTGQKQGLITEVLVHAVGRVVEVALLQTPEGELLAEPNHPVLLGGQWVEIDDALHSGLLHNSSPTLERRFVERFYNLEIDGHMMDGSLHSYMVNGFVVSGLGDNEELNLRFPRQHVWKDKAVQSATEII